MKLWICLFAFMTIPAALSASQSESAVDFMDKENLRELFIFPPKMTVLAYRSFFGKGVKSFCPMKPSCSTYGLQALDQEGAFRGSLAIVDRLNRCGHDLFLYPLQSSSEGIYFFDPVNKE